MKLTCSSTDLLIFCVVFASTIEIRSTARGYRRRTTASTRRENDRNADSGDYASQAIIARFNETENPDFIKRMSAIIRNQNKRHQSYNVPGHSSDRPSPNSVASVPVINCSSTCTPREALRQERLEKIKRDILRKLRLSTDNLPNMTYHRLPDIPFVRGIQEQTSMQNDSPYVSETDSDGRQDVGDHQTDMDHSTALRTIIFPTSPPRFSGYDTRNCYFEFPSTSVNRDVANATFGVYVKRRRNEGVVHPALPAYVFLHLIKSNGKTDAYLKKRIPTWSADDGHWIEFGVQYAVFKWLNGNDAKLGFRVVVEDDKQRFEAVLDPKHPDDEPHKPFLDLHLNDRKTRSKRNLVMTCDERSNELRCCRYPLVIDFETFRWDWVIVPRSYHAFYCSGECPVTYFQSFTHTHVVQQTRADGPCCSPRDLSSISLLYFDTQMNIINGILPGMVVNRCNCN